jgi:hypothetical protein
MKLSIAITALALVATACGGSNAERSNTTTTSSPPSSEPTATNTSSNDRKETTSATPTYAPPPGATYAPPTSAPPAAAATDTTQEGTAMGMGTGTPGATIGMQGNTQAEVDITAAIRRTMVADKTLSFTSKNAVVIANGSTVTLKGTVSSDADKRTLMSIAKRTPGVTHVDDEMEVKH